MLPCAGDPIPPDLYCDCPRDGVGNLWSRRRTLGRLAAARHEWSGGLVGRVAAECRARRRWSSAASILERCARCVIGRLRTPSRRCSTSSGGAPAVPSGVQRSNARVRWPGRFPRRHPARKPVDQRLGSGGRSAPHERRLPCIALLQRHWTKRLHLGPQSGFRQRARLNAGASQRRGRRVFRRGQSAHCAATAHALARLHPRRRARSCQRETGP